MNDQRSSSKKPRRLLALSSGGGHWTELARLSPAFDAFDVLYASTTPGLAAPSGTRAVWVVRDGSRSEPARLVGVFADIVKLLRRFRPDIIVTTGAAPGLLAIAAGKLMGSRTVWIDSIANAEALSMSGRLARRCADVRLTQWPHLADANAGVRFAGSVV